VAGSETCQADPSMRRVAQNARLFAAIEADPKTEVEVDLPAQTITLLSTDESAHFEINNYKKHCLMNGLDDIDFLIENRNLIEAYEQNINA